MTKKKEPSEVDRLTAKVEVLENQLLDIATNAPEMTDLFNKISKAYNEVSIKLKAELSLACGDWRKYGNETIYSKTRMNSNSKPRRNN